MDFEEIERRLVKLENAMCNEQNNSHLLFKENSMLEYKFAALKLFVECIFEPCISCEEPSEKDSSSE